MYMSLISIYIRFTVGDMLHIDYISVRSRGIASHCVQMGGDTSGCAQEACMGCPLCEQMGAL